MAVMGVVKGVNTSRDITVHKATKRRRVITAPTGTKRGTRVTPIKISIRATMVLMPDNPREERAEVLIMEENPTDPRAQNMQNTVRREAIKRDILRKGSTIRIIRTNTANRRSFMTTTTQEVTTPNTGHTETIMRIMEAKNITESTTTDTGKKIITVNKGTIRRAITMTNTKATRVNTEIPDNMVNPPITATKVVITPKSRIRVEAEVTGVEAAVMAVATKDQCSKISWHLMTSIFWISTIHKPFLS